MDHRQRLIDDDEATRARRRNASKHTPGPWHHTGRRGGWDGVTSADEIDICALEYNNPANARLIAAAPELLEALRAATSVLRTFATMTPTNGWAASEINAALRLADPALAKAGA